MPTLKRYQNKPGYYIHARVNNSVITYQTTPQARKLFDELGYTHGSSIPWKLFPPLKDRGDVYTHGAGVEPDVVEDDVSLSPEQNRIYKKYLREDSGHSNNFDRLKTASKELVADSSAVSAEEVTDTLVDASNTPLVRSVEAFSEVPFDITEIKIPNDEIAYGFEVEEGITIVCRDLRWKDDKADFNGLVSYNGEVGTTATYTVRNGYFSAWSMAGGSESESKDIEKVHTNAFKADFGLKSGLGFEVTNWTEVVRKLFLFVANYDIRPDRRGHKGLCSAHELEGKHIWVDAHKTDKSSNKRGIGTFIVTNELVTLKIPELSSPSELLVEVGEITDGKATATPIPPIRAPSSDTE